ncbi:MAG: hypothetical protein HY868_12260 [Chloroflexi bacterium]|nr:hypothetical protein [Chloroflexota bacterium]
MAKTKLNPILEQVRGQVGDLVFKRYNGETVLTRKPDMEGREATEAQLAAREKFRQATLYGKMVMADPDTKTLYEEEAQDRGVPVFSLTVADFYNAPAVDEVDLSAYAGKVGDEISVHAHDDFAVVGVAVAIARTDGQAIEAGDAVETPPGSGRWVYTAKQAVPTGTAVRVNVTAKDHPGHTSTKSTDKV